MSDLHFLLNDHPVSLSAAGPSDTLLDWLRLNRRLTGTKEGCAEGDCGACTVLVGQLRDGSLHYQPVNACIRLLPSLHGCHVVTIEHLRGPEGGLHPVQQAMVDHHASQCGFCTPGIVMSLYALWMQNPDPDVTDIETALQGNLCRCTGYEPIIRAALTASKAGGQAMDALAAERDHVTAQLSAIKPGAQTSRDDQRAIVPANTDAFARALLDNPDATIIAGATDVGLWVTKHLRPISPAIFIGHLMQDIRVTETDLHIGAGVTYSQAEPLIARHFPQILPYWRRIGGWQVRNAGTIGGNVANGSPIGETPPLLIALGATLTLRQGQDRRSLPVQDYFIDYGKQDRAPDEFVESLTIPLPAPDARIAAYKVSKRRDSDITAVAMSVWLRVQDGQITDARIACGGMAATPKRATLAEQALIGQPFGPAGFEAAAQAIQADFQPLSDWRASAGYRRLVAANLLRRFWLDQCDTPQTLTRRIEA
ncbi:xanthine dehydrogenase small subunit [Paracoccus jiaweipingae]|uniref:xanthine dehydrogenase small subunit n=1 Tax=unclassified Paracoccus (in: a-proteobacteria) TaxID=2688777 RepID=UPI0037B60879